MDPRMNLVCLTIASFLLTGTFVSALPSYRRRYHGEELPSSSSSLSSSSSSSGTSHDSQLSSSHQGRTDPLKNIDRNTLVPLLRDIIGLPDDVPPEEVLANSIMLLSDRDPSEARFDSGFQDRHKRQFGIAGLDNIDYILSTVDRQWTPPGTQNYYTDIDKITSLMRKAG